MTKYRILEKDGRYYPQKKFLGLFWYSFYNIPDSEWTPYGYRTQRCNFVFKIEEAQAIINRDYKEWQKTRINPIIKIHHYNPHP